MSANYPPFRKFFRRLWPEFGRCKKNYPLVRGVYLLECPLIGKNTKLSNLSACFHEVNLIGEHVIECPLTGENTVLSNLSVCFHEVHLIGEHVMKY